MIIMGHRGVPSLAPENTLAGFRVAAEQGADWVEMDVTLLADGTPVVNHDASIDRCSNRSGLLSHMSRADLAVVDCTALYPDWPAESVPLLADVVALLNEHKLGLNVELKDHGLATDEVVQQVLDVLRQYDDPERLVISSFDLPLLQACRARSPEVKLGLLYTELPADWLLRAQQLNAYSIHCDWKQLNYIQAKAIKEAGYKLFCWTANQPEEVASLWHWGLDGIISDAPQRFVSAMRHR